MINSSEDRESWGLSVVVTVYTETFSVIETVDRLIKNDKGGLKEIILVVSPKASAETLRITEDLARTNPLVRRHVQKRVPGVGWALREGMSLAKEECVVIMSGDLETEPEAAERMFQKAKETGADLVVGNRWDRDGGFVNYDRFKLICNWFFQKIFKVVYRTRISDLTYGFKLLRRHLIESIEWESEFHEIYIETTVKPLKIGCHAEQVPTVWIGRREGESVNTFFRNFGYVKLALRVQTEQSALLAQPAATFEPTTGAAGD
ncbi:MAG: glycosyltransferase family 2 protein [Bryobacterales bacterium]|nr:glycosyltransferase family 2 protein [Bryobacterales bacterium]